MTTAEVAQITEHLRSIDEKLNTCINILGGSPGGNPGLVVKVDRLEQSEKRRSWLIKAIVVSLIGLILKTFVNWNWQ